LQVLPISAQILKQGFDYFFKPTDYTPRFYVVTEKKDSLWHREAWYLPELGMAMEGWYKDQDCKIEHGTFTWFHPNKVLKSTGNYVNGKKEGTWLEFGEEGGLRDSAYYVAGRLKGIRLQWHPDGMLSDSMQFDGAGNGLEVSWRENGNIFSAGYWVSDTSKRGRWKYYYTNGKIMASEDYVEGKRIAWNCFDSAGLQLDTSACPEREAEFAGGSAGWLSYIQRNLKAVVPVNNGAPFGQFTVVLRFVVDSDGSIKQIKHLTHFGYGMEEEVERMLKKSPHWVPALQFGRKIKAYRIQPVTFVVSKE
jgi:antitoxin component YwqK of YwqJK toxin-antitoxin module